MKAILKYSLLIIVSCKQPDEQLNAFVTVPNDSLFTAADTNSPNGATITDTIAINNRNDEVYQEGQNINTHEVKVQELLNYAKGLIGTPYKYASADPKAGFDCSGFITHVFNHFDIKVPRSSVNFTNVDREIEKEEAKPGDIVLFTGTDPTIRHVGHMGIITNNNSGELSFIHSTSGKAHGVTISPLNKQYTERYVKIIRVFKENDN